MLIEVQDDGAYMKGWEETEGKRVTSEIGKKQQAKEILFWMCIFCELFYLGFIDLYCRKFHYWYGYYEEFRN